MKIISSKKRLIEILKGNKNLGFVHTMGAIHKAHGTLIKRSNDLCDKTVVTIFINRPQFNIKSDFKKYPRVLKKDISLLKKYKVDYLYLPSKRQIYSTPPNKKIKISPFSRKLCGKFRPGHFQAVVDVIDRFIKIIKPSKIFLGEKDMQQLKIVQEFINRNKIKTKVVSCKSIREKNGLVFSSRNFLLTLKEKKIASNVFKLLNDKKHILIKKNNLLNKIKNKILKFGINEIDYLKIIDINKITRPYKKNKKYKIFIAYHIGQTRLIDNI